MRRDERRTHEALYQTMSSARQVGERRLRETAANGALHGTSSRLRLCSPGSPAIREDPWLCVPALRQVCLSQGLTLSMALWQNPSLRQPHKVMGPSRMGRVPGRGQIRRLRSVDVWEGPSGRSGWSRWPPVGSFLDGIRDPRERKGPPVTERRMALEGLLRKYRADSLVEYFWTLWHLSS